MNTARSPRTKQEANPVSPRLYSSDTLLLPGVIGTKVEGPRTPKRTPSRSNSSQFMSPRLPLRPLGQSSHSPRVSRYQDGVVDILPESDDRGASPSITSARWRMKYRSGDTPLSSEKVPRKLYFSSEDERDEDESSWAGAATPTRSRGNFINLVLESDSMQDEGAEPVAVEEVFPETVGLDQDLDHDEDEEEPELTQAQLDAEERERIRESTQLGFIKRITRSLKNGWSTPRKDGATYASDGEDSDSAMSASSARARATQDVYFRQRQARLPRIPPLRTQFTDNSIQRDAPKTHERYGTQTLRNFDSGVAMSMSQDGYDNKLEDPFEDDLLVESGHENLDRSNQLEDEYQPIERRSIPTRGSLYLREDPEYPELESESDYESADVDVLDQEDERYYPSISSSPVEDFQQTDSMLRRQRRSAKRIYPWHVIWRNLVYYTQKGMDLYNAIAVASVSFLWLLWTCIRLSLTWPWTQRYKVHQLSREWYDAGVAVGLLNPGTLFGVALLASMIMYSQPDGQISQDSSSSWNDRTEASESVLNRTRTSRPNPITSTLGRAWEGISWRTSSHGDTKNNTRTSWSDWVPNLPSLDLWIPFKNRDRGTPRIQLPEGDIHSLEELEERIAWIQNTLVDLRRADSKLADGFKGLEDSVHDKLTTKGGQMHDLERRFEKTIAEKENEVQSLENRFRSAIAQKEKEIAELRGLEHRVSNNMAKPLEELQHYLESKIRETDTKVEDMSVWIEGFEHKLQRVSDDVTTLKKYIADGRWIELKVLEIFRDQIPRYLVVSKDPESGKLSIPAPFWDSARELFMTSEQVQKSIDDKLSGLGMESRHEESDGTESTPSKWSWGSKSTKDNKKATQSMSWDEFLSENKIPISNYVDGRATMVSRTVFLNMVRTEATQIWKGLEKNVVALLEKQGKLKGRAPFHHGTTGGSSTGVFDHSTELSDVERDLVNSLIDEALDKYSADVLAKPDYALYSAGGRIIPRLTSPNYHHVVKPTLFGRLGGRFLFPLPRREKPAEKAIEPDVHAGECWAMEGHEGQLAVRLARNIVVTEVTIEHADPSVLLDSGSAAREIEVWSLTTDADSASTSPHRASSTNKDIREDNAADQDTFEDASSDTSSSSNTKEFGSWWREGAPWPGAKLLTTVVYDASAGLASNSRTPHPSHADIGNMDTELKDNLKHTKSRQTFSIPLSKQTEPSQGIVFRIKSNWGHPAYTCVYRVRVHGHER